MGYTAEYFCQYCGNLPLLSQLIVEIIQSIPVKNYLLREDILPLTFEEEFSMSSP